MDHLTFSRKGGKARSAAKTKANQAKARAFWQAVRAGELPKPLRARMPPKLEEIAALLAPYCRRAGITRLEAFGSTSRDEAKRGSDVDLIVSFSRNPGLSFFGMEEDMTEILGVPVHLITRNSLKQMSNPYRRVSILMDAKVIHHG